MNIIPEFDCLLKGIIYLLHNIPQKDLLYELDKAIMTEAIEEETAKIEIYQQFSDKTSLKLSTSGTIGKCCSIYL